MSEVLTPVQVSAELRTEIAKAGTEAEFARIHALRRQDVNDATTGRRPPSLSVLAALGLFPVTRYIRKAPRA